MKTQGMQHQLDGLAFLAERPEFAAVGCEQGTGKTWIILADVEHQLETGRIDAVLVVAPKGVHTNWVRREIPKHMSIETKTAHYLSGMGKRRLKQVEKLISDEPDGVPPILTINIDAVNTKKGIDIARRFLKAHRAYMVVDESQRIKNPSSERTKRTITLGRMARSRRISSGTIIADSPLDAFGQYEFLESGLLGTTSYRAFVAEFAELLPAESNVVQHVADNARASGGRFRPHRSSERPVAPAQRVDVEYENGGHRYLAQAGDLDWSQRAERPITGWRKSRNQPQIIRRDREGQKVYRNINKLKALMAPHTFRVTKAECLDLPAKIYKNQYFELTPELRREYDGLKESMRYEFADGHVDVFSALTIIGKLRQVTSGFIMRDGEPQMVAPENNPRMEALLELVDCIDGKFIIWAAFREEIRQIAHALRELGVVEYHGGVKDADRQAAIDEFQDGDARVFVGHPLAGGTGLTLTAASTAIYYSCDYALEPRTQSEDRCHRYGSDDTRHVVYYDLVADGTIDERIAAALQNKAEVAEDIMSAM